MDNIIVENNIENIESIDNSKNITLKEVELSTINIRKYDNDPFPYLILKFNPRSPLTTSDIFSCLNKIEDIQSAKNINEYQKIVKTIEAFSEMFDNIFDQKNVVREIMRYDGNGYKMEAIYSIIEEVKNAVVECEKELEEEFKKFNIKNMNELKKQAKSDMNSFLSKK